MADDVMDQAIATGAIAEKEPVAIDLEATAEFQAWKLAKMTEVSNYLRNNWKMDVGLEKLVMTSEYDFPDRENRRAYAAVLWSQSYRLEDRSIPVNPITSQPMTYTIWRKIDPPPAPAPEPADVDAQELTDAE